MQYSVIQFLISSCQITIGKDCPKTLSSKIEFSVIYSINQVGPKKTGNVFV